jgi:tetratricopeptide (TPR) repeat protein
VRDPARRGGPLTALALALAPGAAAAAGSAATDLTTRSAAADAEAIEAFRVGVEEGNPTGGPSGPEAGRTAADAALTRGEEEYLKARLRGAEKQFALAADTYLSAPEALDATRASRALTLLAQVHLALGRTAAAEKAIERALRHVPGYPGTWVPPPEVAALLARLRTRPDLQPTGRLTVNSEHAGIEVAVAGLALGPAPVRRDDLPAGPLAVSLTAPDGRVTSTVVDLSTGPAVVTWRPVERLRSAAAEAVRAGDAAGLFEAAAGLERTLGADETCVGILEPDGRALLVRIAGRTRRVQGGRATPAPDGAADFVALGRTCRPGMAGELSSTEAERLLFPLAGGVTGPAAVSGPPASPEGPARWITFALAGLAATAVGVGGYYAWQAKDASGRYDRAQSPSAAERAADDARGAALKADVGFGTGVLLGGAALVLTLWE